MSINKIKRYVMNFILRCYYQKSTMAYNRYYHFVEYLYNMQGIDYICGVIFSECSFFSDIFIFSSWNYRFISS